MVLSGDSKVDLWCVFNRITRLLSRKRLYINGKKTRVMSNDGRAVICGVAIQESGRLSVTDSFDKKQKVLERVFSETGVLTNELAGYRSFRKMVDTPRSDFVSPLVMLDAIRGSAEMNKRGL
jgi:hypothetical protein